VEIEAKRGSEIGKSVLETVCALSNEPNRKGGYIMLGLGRDEGVVWPGYSMNRPGTIEKRDMQKFLLQMLPEMLQEEINKLGKRIAPATLDNLVERICYQIPMSRQKLSYLLAKSDKHMQDCLRRMVDTRRLRRLYPEIYAYKC
jgi:hypothetical protein